MSALRGCFLAAVLLLAPLLAGAQDDEYEYIERSGISFGTTIGLSDLWGDVGTKSIVRHYTNSKYSKNLTAMGGLYLRYTLPTPAVAVRLSGNYGRVYASDDWNETEFNKSKSPKEDAFQRYVRNLNARVSIFETSLMLEILPLRFNTESQLVFKRFQPYIMGGISYYHFNTQAEYTNRQSGVTRWVDIYNLHLEGDGFKFENAPPAYNQWQFNIPLGLGMRWDIGYRLGLGVEYCYRLCMTDYLDGVSNTYIDPKQFDANLTPEGAAIAKDLYDRSFLIDQTLSHKPGDTRGNPSVKDGYSTLSINFFFKTRRKIDGWWR